MATSTPSVPWYRQLTADQWRAFAAAYLGWTLDGFDYVVVTFLLLDIQQSFAVNSTLAGALLSVSLLFRVVGGLGAGAAADRWGRKGPLMLSIVWYSFFTFLSGFSATYTMFFLCRALFGIGMGGVWAAGMPLALEHWPAHLRGIASGLLQGGYAMGYILAALVYQFVYPIVRHQTDATWRVILWAGILPALLVFWIMPKVKESPVWLERQRLLREKQQRHVEPFGRLFTGDLLPITIQTTLLAASFLFMYNSIAVFYPTFLINGGWQTVPFALAFNASAIVGNLIFGRLSETGLGRRGAAAVATVIGALSIPLYLFTPSGALLMAGAAIMGFFGTGNFGVVPGYLNERFPTAARASGAGFSYQAGAAVASFAPAFIGFLHDSGMTLPSAMAVCIAAGSLLVLLFLWLGPETRGREFQAHT